MADSPEYNWAEVDGEEEPLFADDIEDEDIPPLPPPMPPLTQLSQTASADGAALLRVNPNSEENFRGGDRGSGGDGAGGADGTDEQTAAVGKKRKPLLTLTTDRVFSEKGLPALERDFPKLKFKGKGHEAEDLKYLLQQYEHWANRLYPKLTFKDVAYRIERLATTKPDFKSKLVQMRRKSVMGVGVPGAEDSEENPTGGAAPQDTDDNNDPQNTAGFADGDDDLGRVGEAVANGGSMSDSREGGGITDEDIPNLWDANRQEQQPISQGREPDREEEEEEEEMLTEMWNDDEDLVRIEGFGGLLSPTRSRHQDELASEDVVNGSRVHSGRRHDYLQAFEGSDLEDEPMDTEQRDGQNASCHPRIDTLNGSHARESSQKHTSLIEASRGLVNGEGSRSEDEQEGYGSGDGVGRKRGGRKRRLSSDEESDDGALVIADTVGNADYVNGRGAVSEDEHEDTLNSQEEGVGRKRERGKRRLSSDEESDDGGLEIADTVGNADLANGRGTVSEDERMNSQEEGVGSVRELMRKRRLSSDEEWDDGALESAEPVNQHTVSPSH